MATSSILTKEMQELVKPDENLMFTRKGFDRKALRREMAPVRTIAPNTKYVTQGNAVFVHPDSDMPRGPTVEGESFGNIELVREVGGTQMIPRYTNGFVLEEEDMEVPEMREYVTQMRNGIMELFDLRADLAFLLGMKGHDGTQVFKGVFQWLEDNMDANNIIDCSDFDVSAGALSGVPANIVLVEAYKKITGEYVETTWDMAVATHQVWALWNEVGTNDYNANNSQWSLMQAKDDAGVGVGRRMLMPKKIGLRAPTNMTEKLRFDFSFPTATSADDGVGNIAADDDVMYLIPQHNGDFYELYEQATPDVRGPIMKDGFRERWEYKWSAGVVQGQSYKAGGGAVDVIKLENVESLFL